jgi:hypothetical protein
LSEVCARINAVFGPLLGIPIALPLVTGQIQLISKRKGCGALIVVLNASDSTVTTALGLTLGTIVRGTQRLEESGATRDWLFEWTATDGVHSSEPLTITQSVYVLPAGLWKMLPQLRLEIDKAQKLTDPASGCFLGYTNSQLFRYLLGGLQTINAYQPSIFFSPDNYPFDMFGSILVEAALLWGVTSQTLFAVDTDVPSYSDQGQSFVINHQAPLAAYLNSLGARLDRNVPLFKLHFVRSGTVLTQMGPSFRLGVLLDAAPTGATFRNIFTAGPR